MSADPANDGRKTYLGRYGTILKLKDFRIVGARLRIIIKT
jgi:hypothetical protein